jgi:c-di-GMP-binding flagellar brake protein YcgR
MDSILQIKMGKTMYEGSVTYDEGDLIEAVFPDRLNVTVGDQLPCLMTSHYETITNFEAVVIAKDDNRVFLFRSPTASEFREQRRRYPRFDTDLRAWIQYRSADNTDPFGVRNQMVDLINVSLGGLAFRSQRPVPSTSDLLFFVELYGRNRQDGLVQASLQVIHERIDNSYYFYGCKIKTIRSRYFHTLRKYILQRQLEERRSLNL